MVQLENWSGEKENDKKTVLVTGATGVLGE